ncbi:MAG: hypothetical protein FIA99_02575 [Ruminiclostridium sp.]|nr:hypothetical protein [Ruminiclostridium sp.]
MNTIKMMSIQKAVGFENKIEVLTTGAKYVLINSNSSGIIECYQRINGIRLNCTIKFNIPFTDMCIVHQNEERCIINTFPFPEQNIRIQINKDSAMEFISLVPLKMELSGNFIPEYSIEENGNILLADRIGGIGIYPYKQMTNVVLNDMSIKEWRVLYEMEAHSRFIISVFPPREFNEEQSYKDRIFLMSWCTNKDGQYATSPIPSYSDIDLMSKYTNILVFTDILWKNVKGETVYEGMPREATLRLGACSIYDYIPCDEEGFVNAVHYAHLRGMRVLVYMSPYYSLARGEDYLEKVETAISKYDLDGLYFDGLPMDMMESYCLVRNIRNLLGDKILYIHETASPLISNSIYCPFIDTYADFTLRAEHTHDFSEKYLRFVVSGYNTSNAIGTVCYVGYPEEFVGKLIDSVFKSNTRFPLSYIGEKAGLDDKLIIEKYFPKLDELYKNYCK